MHCYVDMSSCCVRLLIVLPDIIATLNVHVTDLNEHAILLSLTKRCKKCTRGNNSKSQLFMTAISKTMKQFYWRT